MTSAKISAKKDSKRERIIEAASALFSEKNFHEVMMTDVAQRASIAKGTLYNYYNSKEDLYFSVMLIRMNNLISSLKKKIQDETTALRSLHSFIIHNYMFLMKYQCFFRMYQRENLNASNLICDELRNKNTELRDILYNILCQGIQEHSFRDVDQNLVTDLILGGIFAAVNKGIKENYSTNLQVEDREKIYTFIINGLLNGSNVSRKRILITRSENDAADFTSELSGSEIIYLPTIEVVPSADENIFKVISSSLSNYDYLVLTSANSVRILAEKFLENNIKPDYNSIKVAVVGKKSATECGKYSIPVHLIPELYSAEGLIKLFASIDLKDKKVLIPGSLLSDETLPDFFKQSGALVNAVSIYDVKLPESDNLKDLIHNVTYDKPGVFVFTSPSSFRNYLQLLRIDDPLIYFQNSVIAVIGNTTKAEVEQHNLTVDILPQENTLTGLGRSVRDYINKTTNQESY